jgi:hypothetical protein
MKNKIVFNVRFPKYSTVFACTEDIHFKKTYMILDKVPVDEKRVSIVDN